MKIFWGILPLRYGFSFKPYQRASFRASYRRKGNKIHAINEKLNFSSKALWLQKVVTRCCRVSCSNFKLRLFWFSILVCFIELLIDWSIQNNKKISVKITFEFFREQNHFHMRVDANYTAWFLSRENKIQAIEAKLRRMEKGEETSTNVIRTINNRTERQFQRNKPHPYQSRHKRPRTR